MGYVKGEVMQIVLNSGKLYIDGVESKDAPVGKTGNNIVQDHGRLFVNGYEYKNGKWVKNPSAVLHQFFG